MIFLPYGRKRIPNTRIISALLTTNSVKDAAKSARCSQTVIFERLKDDQFQKEMHAAQADLMHESLGKLSQLSTQAVQTLADIMNDPDATDTSKISTAKIILDKSIIGYEDTQIVDQIRELKTLLKEKGGL